MKFSLRTTSALLFIALIFASFVLSGCAMTKKKKPAESSDSDSSEESGSKKGSDSDSDSKDSASTDSEKSSKEASLAGSDSDKSSKDLASASEDSSADSSSRRRRRHSDDSSAGSGESGSSPSKTELADASTSTDAGKLDSRHGATVVEDTALAAAPATDAPAADAVLTPKKKKKKKKVLAEDVATATPENSDVDVSDAEPSAKGVYVVKKGDTLSKIAHERHIKLSKLLKLNHMTPDDATKLKIGTKLKLSAQTTAD
jgi:LysM repeat protein